LKAGRRSDHRAPLDAGITLGHHRPMLNSTLRARCARLLMVSAMALTATQAMGQSRDASYDALVNLFTEWRAFETPPLRDGAPDYTAATFKRRHAELPRWQARLAAIKPDTWPIAQQVDWQIVRAEMNGFDFYVRVLQPWVRDPAYYISIWTAQSDTPAHEGPTNHAAI
jgi:hypothetical protein